VCKYSNMETDLNTDNALARLVKLMERKKKILEFGCATGYVSKLLKEEFDCSVTGIEINPEAAKEAEKYCERVLVGDMEEMDYARVLGNEKYDIAIFGDVLEHLKEPAKVLMAICPFLSDLGYVLASIPNIAHISVAMELLDGRFDYRPLGLLDEMHLRFFTKWSIASLFRNAGFEVVLWDRVMKRPEDTEFQTVLEKYPPSLVSFLGAHSEALTYQFIVKAVPMKNKIRGTLESGTETTMIEQLESRISEMEMIIRILKRDFALKEGALNSVLSSWSWRITTPLRCLYRFVERVRRGR
jgi:2-polyprenyl-3-methyl-5-hydroxy-6-metoxy-1,4-benzoquinol methylase